MHDMHITKPIDATAPPSMRLWALPFFVCILIALDLTWVSLDSLQITMVASVAIVIAGIPHGTLDVEIATARFGSSTTSNKLAILSAYIGCALMMILLWQQIPELALTAFLIISIVHFSTDWREGAEPFLAMMVGWALIALPALSHPQSVAMIFEMLTGNQNGATISAVLACASVPAALGSLVFAYNAYENGEYVNATEVLSCLVAAICLPPLIAFAIFFCGLHSPRHMADAIRETGDLSAKKKLFVIVAVFALSMGMGALLFVGDSELPIDAGIIRTAFILLSTLTVPHFVLEQILAAQKPAR